MNKTLKKVLATSASAVVACATVAPVYATIWGDNSGLENGRKSYTEAEIDSGVLGDTIVMNSISDGTIGDEKDFVAARLDNGDNGKDNVWNYDSIKVEDGKDYIVRLYVHNNNPKGLEAVATGVKTFFAIGQESASEVRIDGKIHTDNANPTRYWDSVVFKSADGSNFHLEYYDGSALLENNGIGKNGGIKLSDNIVTEGTLIGYDALDGRVPGCYKYANYVTIKVKAVYDNDYTVSKLVRNVTKGEEDFAETTKAEIGDEVEYEIYYENTSEGIQKGVTVVDKLAANLEYIEGSTELYNTEFPNGAKAEDKITTSGLNIGSYDKGANAYLYFKAKVVDNSLDCGENEIPNWAQISINGKTVRQDGAFIETNKVCKEPETCDTNPEMEGCKPEEPKEPTCDTNPEMEKCKPADEPKEIVKTGADIAGTVLGAGSLTTALGYYISSRKNLKRF